MIYLGTPGSLQPIRSPRGGVQIQHERQSQARTTLGGGRIVDYTPGLLRTWTFTYTFLPAEDRAALLAFYAGHNGVGPWMLLDDGDRNWLTVEQSAAGSAAGDTTGFAVTGGALLAAAWGGPRGPRQLAWDLDGVGSATLTLDPPRTEWFGHPVVPGRTVRWQAQMFATNDLAASVTPVLTWVDQFGATVSASSGTATPATDTPTMVSVEATCPTYAAYAQPSLVTTRASGGSARMGSGRIAVVGPGFGPALVIDQPQLWMPSPHDTGTTWVPGLGVPLVSLTTWEHTTAWVPHSDNTLTLVEVR